LDRWFTYKKRVELSMARQKSPDGHGKFPGNFHLIKLGDQTLSYEGTQKFGRLDMCETIQWSSPAPPKKTRRVIPWVFGTSSWRVNWVAITRPGNLTVCAQERSTMILMLGRNPLFRLGHGFKFANFVCLPEASHYQPIIHHC
jgi:hypothetical protein